MPDNNQIDAGRRRFLLLSAMAVVGSTVSLLPAPMHAKMRSDSGNAGQTSPGVTVFAGYPELCTPGNNVPYVPAVPAANRKSEAEIFLW